MTKLFSIGSFVYKKPTLGDYRIRDSVTYLLGRALLVGGASTSRWDKASLFLLNSNKRSAGTLTLQLARNVLRLRLLARFEQLAVGLFKNRDVLADDRTFGVKRLVSNFQKKASAKLQRLEVLRYQLQAKERFDEEQQELTAATFHGVESSSELQRRFLRFKLRNYIYRRAAKLKSKKTRVGGRGPRGGVLVEEEQPKSRYSVRLGSLAEGVNIAWWRPNWQKGVRGKIVQKSVVVPPFLRNQYSKRRRSWPVLFWYSQARTCGKLLGSEVERTKTEQLFEKTEGQHDVSSKNATSGGESVSLPVDWVGLSIPVKGWLANLVNFKKVGFFVRRKSGVGGRLLSISGLDRSRSRGYQQCRQGVFWAAAPPKDRLVRLANSLGYLRSFTYRSGFCKTKLGLIVTCLNRSLVGLSNRLYVSRPAPYLKVPFELSSVWSKVGRCVSLTDLNSSVRLQKCWRAAAFVTYREVLGVGSKKTRGWREFQGGLGLSEFRVNSGRSQGEKRAVKRGKLTFVGLQQFRSLIGGLDRLGGGPLGLHWFGYMPHRLISKTIGGRLQRVSSALSEHFTGGYAGRCLENIFELSKSYRAGLGEIRAERALKALKQLTKFVPIRFILANRLRGLPYRLYVTGRKKSIFYAIVDSMGRPIFTFSSGMVSRVRFVRRSIGLRGVVVGKKKNAVVRKKSRKSVSRISLKSRRTPSGLGVRRIRKPQSGRKPRGIKRRGGLSGGKRRRRAKLYFDLFKHHLRPLVSFLVGGGLLGCVGDEDRRRWCQLVVVVRGAVVMRKITRRIVLELVKVLTRSNKRIYSYLDQHYGT